MFDFKVQRIPARGAESVQDVSLFWKLLRQMYAQTILRREKN